MDETTEAKKERERERERREKKEKKRVSRRLWAERGRQRQTKRAGILFAPREKLIICRRAVTAESGPTISIRNIARGFIS